MEDISAMYALDQPEIKLKNYMYKTVYTLSALRRTLFCDKLDFLRENSRLLNQYTHRMREHVETFGKIETLIYQVLKKQPLTTICQSEKKFYNRQVKQLI